LTTEGINCEGELAFAFEQAGAAPEFVHVNDVKTGEIRLKDYQILALPGGFSYGDDIASGRVFANETIFALADQTNDYINHQGLVLGVCNGFQVLVRSGLLPFREPIRTLSDMRATLTPNDAGHFECRWVNLRTEPEHACVFLQDMEEHVSYPVAHGEGRFYAAPEERDQIEEGGLVVFRYVDERGSPTETYPDNPNGSVNAIAGITDPTGRILGLMPHPERYVTRTQHPNWRTMRENKPHGLPIFENMVRYAKEM
jgi:phosphoribosylformylglycinamidine synthase